MRGGGGGRGEGAGGEEEEGEGGGGGRRWGTPQSSFKEDRTPIPTPKAVLKPLLSRPL